MDKIPQLKGLKRESIIACTVIDKWGYVGVGISHHGEAMMQLLDAMLYMPNCESTETPPYGSTETKDTRFMRRMMTNRGRIVQMAEAWEIADALGDMPISKESKFREMREKFGADIPDDELSKRIDSQKFSRHLDFYGDIEAAEKFASELNAKTQARLREKYGAAVTLGD